MATITERKLILGSQKNEVFERLQLGGFDPAEFAWGESPSHTDNHAVVSRLTHRPSGYYFDFDFDFDDASPLAFFSPGEQAQTQMRPAVHWNGQLTWVIQWLKFLRREIEAPPLWETFLSADAAFADAATAGSNAPFSAQELRLVEERVAAIRAFVTQVGLNPAQLAGANQKLDYLVDAAKRAGRRDWTFLAIGLMFTVAWETGMGAEHARSLLLLLGEAVGRLLAP